MSLHLLLGPMFAEKTTEMIRYIRRFRTLEYDMFCFKADLDTRYTKENKLCSHNQDTEPCHLIPIDGLHEINQMEEFKRAKVIMIEEGQFFKELYSMVKQWMDVDKKHIYISALAGDKNRQPFGDIIYLIPLAHHVKWLTALCKTCKDGTEGVYSKEKKKHPDQIHVGTSDEYESVCLEHYLCD